MRRVLLLTPALVAGLLGVPGSAAAAGPAVSLEQASARAASLSTQLEQAAARDGGYRVALERLEREHELAQARLDASVRAVFTTRRLDPLAGFTSRLAATGLRRLSDSGASAAVRVDRDLVDAVAGRADAAAALRAEAGRARARLSDRAAAALQAQELARRLLAQARARLVSAALDTQRRAAEQARLAAVEVVLDVASAVTTTALTTTALTPSQTRRSRRSAEREAPVLALVEAAGNGYPAGYAPTGEVLTGLASWYGPGFVGSPTASGTPYDPERLTCAHKTLPLGTVVRVSANDRSVSCLVNDRGPYVGPRILDMSRAGSRALGYDGVQRVVVEVLAATPLP